MVQIKKQFMYLYTMDWNLSPRKLLECRCWWQNYNNNRIEKSIKK